MNSGVSGRNGLKRLAAGVAVAALMCGLAPLGAVAQPAESVAAVPVSLSIAPQSLDGALTALADQANLQILFTSDEVAGLSTGGLSGSYTASEALATLLAGTGLTYEFTGANVVALRRVAEVGGTTTLPSLVVYGAKNTTTLEDTTASVGIVTAEEIEDHQIQSFRGAFRMMGNVMDGDWPDAGFVIRGVNSEGLTPGGAPLASLYIDGAQQTVMGARRGARGLWDVEQVEVYRGPQSTLTGRAALAGAVYVKTKDPTFDWEAKGKATIGTMDTRGTAFMVNAPLVEDQLAMRVSAEYNISENDINYPAYTGFDRYDEFVENEYYNIRGKLLLLPNGMPDTSALLTYSFSHDSPYSDDIAGPVLGFPLDADRGDFNLPVFAESRTTEVNNVSFEVKHDLTSSLLLTSLTSFSRSDMERPSINEGTAGETNVLSGGDDRSILTQEFRVNYEAGRWKAVAGIYLADEEMNSGYVRPDYFGNFDVSRASTDSSNAALFGEATYEFIPTWKVVAGGRLDYTDQESTNFFSRNGAVTTNQSSSFEETVFLPKAGLIKELAPEHTLGFTVQQGFRNGGSGVQTSSGTPFTYDPEETWNYEVSYKGAFFDRRLQLSANAFYTDWKDQQVEILQNPLDFTSGIIVNAASSELYGFEIEGRYAVTPELSTFVSLGHVQSEFENFSSVSTGNLSGMPFPEAPEWSFALGAFYESDTGFFFGGDTKYTSSYMTRIDGAPQEDVDAYWVSNAQAGYKMDGWKVTVFAENLFDERYYTYIDTAGGVPVAATLGPRQLVGVSLEVEF
ncbi:MAG: TonB-dependent receptor [Parvibaculum sp.]|jgi:outer membrane receptor protein involved in Fe transport|uniref:TonB-dependent receptor domain-containing protein n=1 Tax=Parvibaculum sp. TaxID=2024848 RepID=UPI000C40FA3F|nr:TonB-dependent receptor [Parvibaculum sp.]MAU62587.1 TonB-dependent receptor [Parvibaculum sp.]|tara:strand:- start:12856 stop:15234 length:2379 start_codon:yes stop_codon:yes gene_type:complete